MSPTTKKKILTAFILNVGAGLSTCVGGMIIFHPRLIQLAHPSSLAMALALSAGVMIFISLAEIFNESVELFQTRFTANNTVEDVKDRLCKRGEQTDLVCKGHAQALATLCFLLGAAMIFLLDFLVHRLSPDADRQLDLKGIESLRHSLPQLDRSDGETVVAPSTENLLIRKNLNRTGILTALAIILHNIPEGIVTFTGAMERVELGVTLAVSIALHNIPEGMAVAAPVYFATRSRCRAFLWTLLSALAEPLGGLICFSILHNTSNDFINAVLFGLVSGMMVTISLKELIPTALRFCKSKEKVTGATLVGMLVMALSLVLFGYTIDG